MNKKGITLVALVVTVLVMTILGTAAVGSVIGLVKVARIDGYEITSRIVREQVDVIYSEIMSGKEENETFDEVFKSKYTPGPLTEPAKLPTSGDYVIPEDTLEFIGSRFNMGSNEVRNLNYYVFDNVEAKKIIGIEDSELDFYVNFEKNIVFSMSPIKIKDKDVYTLEEYKPDFEVNERNVEYESIKIGDIIIYDPTAGVTDSTLLTATSIAGSAIANDNQPGNGHSNQTITINANDSNLNKDYIVIGKDNGRLKIMSRLPVQINGTDLSLSGGRSFLYLENELHKLCSVFGHGIGADTNNVTEYTIGYGIQGDSNFSTPIEVKKMRRSGARSITLEDLQELTTTDLSGSGDTTNPTTAAKVPSLNGINEDGEANTKVKNIPLTYKLVSSTAYELKPGINTSLRNNIFISGHEYSLASKTVNSSYSYARFRLARVTYSSITGDEVLETAGSVYNPKTVSSKIRPVVFLRQDVKLKKGSVNNTWEVIQ